VRRGARWGLEGVVNHARLKHGPAPIFALVRKGIRLPLPSSAFQTPHTLLAARAFSFSVLPGEKIRFSCGLALGFSFAFSSRTWGVDAC